MISDIFALIIIFIFWCLLNVWTVSVSRKTFGFCMPVTFMVSTLVLFASGMVFHSFKPGFYLLVIAAVAVVVAAANFGILKYLRKSIVYSGSSVSKDDVMSGKTPGQGMSALDTMLKSVGENYLSNGFFAFIALFVFFGVLDFGRHFWAWDEFDHWGVMIKEILRLDDFYCIEKANLYAHRDYPPFSSLFMSLWCMLRGKYDEGLVTTAIHVLEFSMVTLPVMDWYKGKRTGVKNGIEQFFNSLVLIFSLAVFIMSFDKYGIFGTVYPDILMPIFMVYSAAIIMDVRMRKTLFGFFAIQISGISVLLTKQMGICFTLLIWLLYVLVGVVDQINNKRANAGFDKKLDGSIRVIDSSKETDVVEDRSFGVVKTGVVFWLRCFFYLIVAVAPYILWASYIKSFGIVGQFDSGNVKFGKVLDIMQGFGTENELLIAENFLGHLFHKDLCCGILPLPYFVLNGLFVLSIIAIAFVFYYDKKTKNIQRKGALIVIPYVITVIVGCVCYAFTMFVLYLFCFPGETEGGALPSYTRYMGSYIIGIILMVFLFLFYNMQEHKKEIFSIINMAVVFCFIFFAVGKEKLGSELVPQGFIEEKYSFYHEIADMIREVADEDDTILILSANGGQDIVYLQYYITECHLSWEYISKDIPLILDSSVSEWDEIDMVEYDHVYVFVSSYIVDLKLAKPGGIEAFEKGSLYRIILDESGGYRLEIEKRLAF